MIEPVEIIILDKKDIEKFCLDVNKKGVDFALLKWSNQIKVDFKAYEIIKDYLLRNCLYANCYLFNIIDLYKFIIHVNTIDYFKTKNKKNIFYATKKVKG